MHICPRIDLENAESPRLCVETLCIVLACECVLSVSEAFAVDVSVRVTVCS